MNNRRPPPPPPGCDDKPPPLPARPAEKLAKEEDEVPPPLPKRPDQYIEDDEYLAPLNHQENVNEFKERLNMFDSFRKDISKNINKDNTIQKPCKPEPPPKPDKPEPLPKPYKPEPPPVSSKPTPKPAKPPMASNETRQELTQLFKKERERRISESKPPKINERETIVQINERNTTQTAGKNNESNLFDYPWFHGDLDRETQKTLFGNHSSQGDFIVRNSSKDKDTFPYALVVLFQGELRNLRIRCRREDGYYAIGEKKKETEVKFPDVQSLIEHHQKNPLTILEHGVVKLGKSPKKR